MSANDVLLGEVLTMCVDEVPVDPAETYRIAGVYSFGRGLFGRPPLAGTETTYKVFHRLHEGDIVLSQLKAWEGAIARVPREFDGWYLSPQFPTFRVVADTADASYVEWFLRQPRVWNSLRSTARGMGARRDSVSPKQFLSLSLPLPKLEAQRRIAASLDGLACKIRDAQASHRAAAAELEALVSSFELSIWPESAVVNAPSLAEVTDFLARGRQSAQGDSEHFLIKSQHVQMDKYVPTRMTLAPHVASKVGDDARVLPGDTLIACSAAGCLGRVAYFSEAGVTASTDTHVAIARANRAKILPEYLYAYLRGAQGQYQLRSRERGDWTKEKISFRLAELNQADLRRVPVPLPALRAQQAIVDRVEALRTRVRAVTSAKAAVAAELDAMLPSVLARAFNGA
ncbi:restriction endonuclease subunit S [Anaeromyxobacter sp. SG26]|uniref:restriction endonuclease subunit S n=1 Tax=Anaeromyxobacter sp. SG26 TaxID=2925407 RepID=UPI001F573513|nr:restriction endonuclease subunit S [Anaeromyxobacter sp. SG26]